MIFFTRRWLQTILFFMLASAFFSQGQAAGVQHWEFAGWEGAGCYPNVEFDPNVKDRVYLTSDVAGIWRSDDLGEHWRFITKGLGNLHVALIVPAPSDPNILYAGTKDGIFYSNNAGESWSAADNAGGRLLLERPASYRSVVVSKTDPARLIAGTSKGEIFYSVDSGKKWKSLGTRSPFVEESAVTALAWMEKEGVLYASSARGLARFDFADPRWTLSSESPKEIADFWMDPADARHLCVVGQNKSFTSSDGGNTWTHGSLIPRGVLFRLLVPADGQKTLLAAWNDGWKGGVVRSEDGGEKWKPWDMEMKADVVSDPTRAWAGVHGRINALKADPFNKDVLFRTDWWGVWRSDDGGVTWNEKIEGAPNTVMTDIAVSPGGEIYAAAMDNGLLKSTDGGKSYQPLFPATGYADDVNGHAWRVRFAGDAVLATSTPWGLGADQVILSHDRGATFQKVRQGLPLKRPKKNTVWDKSYARALAVHPKESNKVYLGIDGDDGGGFFVSGDGGRSWSRSPGQPGSFRIYNGLAVDPEQPERILWGASGKNSGVYLTENAGGTWRLAEGSHVMKNVFDLAFGPEGRVYAAGDDGSPVLYVSEDHGDHWKLLKKFEELGGAKGLCVLPDGRVAVGTTPWEAKAPGHVYLGSADGKIWERIDGDLPEGSGPVALAYDKKESTLYLARTAGSIYKMKMDL